MSQVTTLDIHRGGHRCAHRYPQAFPQEDLGGQLGTDGAHRSGDTLSTPQRCNPENPFAVPFQEGRSRQRENIGNPVQGAILRTALTMFHVKRLAFPLAALRPDD
jgi:hypothetical protein